MSVTHDILRCFLKHSLFFTVLILTLTQALAADHLVTGTQVKSEQGVLSTLAVRSDHADVYSVFTFARSGNCANSPLCDTDVIEIKGPGGVAVLNRAIARTATAAFSSKGNPVAVTIVPEDIFDGYGYVTAHIFVFNQAKKPVAVMDGEPVLINNLEGSSCMIDQALCYKNKFDILFRDVAGSAYQDVILHQTGTQMARDKQVLIKVDRTYTFTFDSKNNRYMSKR
jgi:hypothetical protein